MVSNKIPKNISQKQEEMALRIFDLIIGRVLKQVYLRLDENGKKDAERVFTSNNDKDKDEFVKKYIPDFKKLFKEESKNIENELKIDVENQV
ncbi:MAG: hypothetical protein WCK10_00095 [Candidatus Staskawiczbacteria bacterium]